MMKKTLALLLALLMVTSCMVFTVAAEEAVAETPIKIIPYATGADLARGSGNNYHEPTGAYWSWNTSDSAIAKTTYDATEQAIRFDYTGTFSTSGTVMFMPRLPKEKSIDITDMNYLCFDLYISDVTAAAGLPMDLELRHSTGTDTNGGEANYRLPNGNMATIREIFGKTLQKGWNHFEIPLDSFPALTDEIRKDLCYIRFYNNGGGGYAGETLTLMMKNIYFSDTSLKVEPDQLVDGVYYLSHNHTVYSIGASYGSGVGFNTPEGRETGLDLRNYEFLEMDIWIGHEDLNNLSFTWEMSATASYDGRVDGNGNGIYGEAGDGAGVHEQQIGGTVTQLSGTKLVAGEWTTVRIPLSLFKTKDWDYSSWKWFRMYNHAYTNESFGTARYAFRISEPRFIPYEKLEERLVWDAEATNNPLTFSAYDVSVPSSGPAQAVNKIWLDDVDNDGDKEWVLINTPANDGDPASASGWFFSNGGWVSNTDSDANKALAATYSGIKSSFTVSGDAMFVPLGGKLEALEFDIYISSGGIDRDAAAGTAPTAEQATDSILDTPFYFQFNSADYRGNAAGSQLSKHSTLRAAFGDLELDAWNHVRIEFDSSWAGSNSLVAEQLVYFRMYNAERFGYYNGLTIAIDDLTLVCDYSDQTMPAGQSDVITLNYGTASFGTNTTDKTAPYAGHSTNYFYNKVPASDSNRALYWDYFYGGVKKCDQSKEGAREWAQRNLATLTNTLDMSAYDTVSLEIHWEADPDMDDSFAQYLISTGQWCFEIKSNKAGKIDDSEEAQWTSTLTYFVPQLTNDKAGYDALRAGGSYRVDLKIPATATLQKTHIKAFGAFFQMINITVPQTGSFEVWIDNIYFKDSTYVAPEEPPVEEQPITDLIAMSATPTLDDTFNLDFMAIVKDGMNPNVTPVVDLIYDGVTTRLESVVKDGEMVYPFDDIFAHRMADSISLRVFAIDENGSMVCKNSTYSIKQYCAAMLGETEDAALKDLLSATLRYGAAAQTYAAYNTGALATDGVEGMTVAPAFDVESISKIDSTLSRAYNEATDAYKWRGATLVLDSAMTIRYSFRANSVEGLTITDNAGNAYTTFGTATDSVGTYYYVDVPVYAYEFDEVLTLSFDGDFESETAYTMSYSVNHYVATKYDGTQKKTSALLEAIYNYGVAADAYVAAMASAE